MRFWLAGVLAVLVCLASNATASEQITRLDPPLYIDPFYQLEDPNVSDPICVDFNHDGQVDFRLWFGYYGVEAYFNSPTRIVIGRQFYPWTTNVYGSVGALPFGTVIGSNLVSSVDTNVYLWHWGDTNRFGDETQAYGNHKSIAVSVLDPETIGMPLVVGGDLPDKEGVMAVEFLIGTNKHYGYIHFDFRRENGWYQGCGGYILGWAYETEPGRPLIAAPIAVPSTPFRLGVRARSKGVFDLDWRATPGATYRVQGAATMAGPFADFTSDIIPPSGRNASPIIELVTFYGMEGLPAYFWRVVRTR
jgi:hypothetical protein